MKLLKKLPLQLKAFLIATIILSTVFSYMLINFGFINF